MSQIATQNGSPIFKLPLPAGSGATAVVFYRAALASDVDGSENAYGPNNEGTDYTANAGEPNHWWALVCGKDGKPIIVGGYYVSTTTLQDPAYPADDRRRYVDAQSIPFIVLPAAHYKAWGIRPGDVAWTQRVEAGKVVSACAAIFADAGPAVGEGSAALCRAHGIDPDPRKGGTSERCIQVYVFCGSGTGRPLALAEINERVKGPLAAMQSLKGLAAPIVG